MTELNPFLAVLVSSVAVGRDSRRGPKKEGGRRARSLPAELRPQTRRRQGDRPGSRCRRCSEPSTPPTTPVILIAKPRGGGPRPPELWGS